MSLSQVGYGEHTPQEFNVIIEIPMHSSHVKYEVDKETGVLTVDRFMATPMFYPANYGYIPHTLSEDGDPVDVLVLASVPLLPGCVVRCRPVGLLNMQDESGVDAKILAVPVTKIAPEYKDIKSFGDLPQALLSTIEHFFSHYKDLESGKWVKLSGWSGVEEACQEVDASIARANS